MIGTEINEAIAVTVGSLTLTGFTTDTTPTNAVGIKSESRTAIDTWDITVAGNGEDFSRSAEPADTVSSTLRAHDPDGRATIFHESRNAV
jgi:hypothetical protein